MARSPLLGMALGFMASQAIYAVAELELADHLAAGPRTADDLAAATDTDPPSLLRLLRAATALGILGQTGSGSFELTELGHHLRGDAPDSVRDFIRVTCGRDFWQPWGELVGSLRSGRPAFDEIAGMPIFDYLTQHPDKAAVFNSAMSDITRQIAPVVAAGYDFSRYGTIVDVGGGDGTLLAEVLRTAPGTRGILYDLPAGVEGAAPVLEAAGVAERCRVESGDFFVSVPAGADAYLMKSVIHDWDDDRAVTILQNCRKAMAPDGRVLIVERTVPEQVTPKLVELLMIDLNMLVCAGGKERTEAEYQALLDAAGLAMVAVTDPLGAFADRVIEAAPA